MSETPKSETKPEIEPASETRKRERRSTVVEESHQALLDVNETILREKANRKNNIKKILKNVKNEFYNSEYREFLSRDAKSWFKLALFYFCFFIGLSLFFAFLLWVFYLTIDPVKPTYYNTESVMNQKGVNPGLGFRPQISPEDELITIDLADKKNTKGKYVDLLKLYLEKHEKLRNESFTGFKGDNVTFDYHKFTDNTPCSVENDFGLLTNSPCVLVKLNRIFGWMPKAISFSELPINDKSDDNKKTEPVKPYIYILCNGETAVDKDNIGKIKYYSSYPSNDVGGIHFRYFPYLNQPGYLSPFVFVQLENVPTNVLINVECKAYAKNIINTDRVYKTGLVDFQVYISNITHSITDEMV